MNTRYALATIAIFACTVASIQQAHFAVTESFLVYIATTIALLSLYALKHATMRSYIRLGIAGGIALAAKTSALSFLAFPAVSWLFSFSWKKRKIIQLVILSFIFLECVLIFFTFLSPFTFLDAQHFLESQRYESGVAVGTLPVVYTLQFNNTLAYLFQLRNFFWQIGVFAAVGIIGIISTLIYSIYYRRKDLIMLLSFPLIYFAYVGSWHTKFVRYMMPMIPFLILFGVYLLYRISRRKKLVGEILTWMSIISTALWACAFMSIYLHPQTRIVASEWMYTHIPPNSKILQEHWDDGLPVPVPGYSIAYRTEQLTIYDNDQDIPTKSGYYADKLSGADYIVINSRRLYGTLLHLPKLYPVTSKYYKLLFAGDLGYKKIAEFSSYPQLFGIIINDDSSEESFQVYDHPKPMIFENVERLPRDQIYNILMSK